MSNLRDRILAKSFTTGEFMLAAGHLANNKFDTDKIAEDPDLYSEVLQEMGRLVIGNRPDFITYVPDGSKKFAFQIGREYGKPLIHLKTIQKRPGHVDFDYILPIDRAMAQLAERVVIIEDVIRTRLSTAAVVQVIGPEKIAGIVGIIDRGLPEDRIALPVEPNCLITEPLPAVMTPEQIATYSKIGQVAA